MNDKISFAFVTAQSICAVLISRAHLLRQARIDKTVQVDVEREELV